MKIGFIGAGKLGTMLGRYFVSQGIGVTGYFSAHESSTRVAATRTATHVFHHLSELISASDLIFITVTDGALVAPNRAYFGQKDAQQLLIVRRMVRDLNFDIQVIYTKGLICSLLCLKEKFIVQLFVRPS